MSSDDNRGLASADEETRERVAREGGKASHSGGGGGEGKGFAGIGSLHSFRKFAFFGNKLP